MWCRWLAEKLLSVPLTILSCSFLRSTILQALSNITLKTQQRGTIWSSVLISVLIHSSDILVDQKVCPLRWNSIENLNKVCQLEKGQTALLACLRQIDKRFESSATVQNSKSHWTIYSLSHSFCWLVHGQSHRIFPSGSECQGPAKGLNSTWIMERGQ